MGLSGHRCDSVTSVMDCTRGALSAGWPGLLSCGGASSKLSTDLSPRPPPGGKTVTLKQDALQ